MNHDSRMQLLPASAECREKARKKLAQAARDERHAIRLTNAAEAWLFLASQLSRWEAAACGLLALDASRTVAERTESRRQQTLWLKMANEVEEHGDARRLRIALRATK
jgi:hypothetical protein